MLVLNNPPQRQAAIISCAVIGDPIAHSLSPLIHHQFANQCGLTLFYEKILGQQNSIEFQIKDFFEKGGLGMNITTPFKEKAFQLATHHEPAAQLAGVANTLWLNDKGELCADNTDAYGLLYSLEKHTCLKAKKVLLLGAGGAAKGVISSLLMKPIAQLTVANRTLLKLEALEARYPNISVSSFDELTGHFDIIINATTSSLNETLPSIPEDILKGAFCLDMFYDLKKETTFVSWAKKKGAAKSIDGLEMLVAQAKKSFECWHHKEVEVLPVLKFLL